MWVIREANQYMVISMDSIGYTVDYKVETPEEATQFESKAAAQDVLSDLGDYWIEQCWVVRV